MISFDIDPLDLAPTLTYRNGDSSLPKIPTTTPTEIDVEVDVEVNGIDEVGLTPAVKKRQDAASGSDDSDDKKKQNGIGSNGDCSSLASSGETVPGEILLGLSSLD